MPRQDDVRLETGKDLERMRPGPEVKSSSVSQTILTVARNRSWTKKPVPETAASQVCLTRAEHSKKPFGKWTTNISTDGEVQRRFRIRDNRRNSQGRTDWRQRSESLTSFRSGKTSARSAVSIRSRRSKTTCSHFCFVFFYLFFLRDAGFLK